MAKAKRLDNIEQEGKNKGMATINERLDAIIEKLGGTIPTADELISTKLDNVIELKGGSMPTEDELYTTKLDVIISSLGGALPTEDELITTKLKAIITLLGGDVSIVPDNLTSSLLESVLEYAEQLLIEKVYGKSVVMNQLSRIKSEVCGWATTMSGFSTSDANKLQAHKYLFDLENEVLDVIRESTTNIFRLLLFGNSQYQIGYRLVTTVNKGDIIKSKSIITIQEKDVGKFTNVYFYGCGNDSIGRTASTNCTLQLIDLTQMFGAGNEPTLEECEQIFHEDYYPYDEGSLMSVEELNAKVTGANIWDEEWEEIENKVRSKNYISVMSNTTYAFKFANDSFGKDIIQYDKNYNVVKTWTWFNEKNNNLTTVSNCAYIKFRLVETYGKVYNHDLAIIKGTTATEYEPYIEPQTAQLDCTLRSAGTARDVLDVKNNQIIRNVGTVTLTGNESVAFYTNCFVIGKIVDKGKQQMKYTSNMPIGYIGWSNATLTQIQIGSSAYNVTNIWTNVQSFKDDCKAKYEQGNPYIICYELATPTTEPFDCSAFKRLHKNAGTTIIEITDQNGWPVEYDASIEQAMPMLLADDAEYE